MLSIYGLFLLREVIRSRLLEMESLPRLPKNCHAQVVTPKNLQTKLATLLEQP